MKKVGWGFGKYKYMINDVKSPGINEKHPGTEHRRALKFVFLGKEKLVSIFFRKFISESFLFCQRCDDFAPLAIQIFSAGDYVSRRFFLCICIYVVWKGGILSYVKNQTEIH